MSHISQRPLQLSIILCFSNGRIDDILSSESHKVIHPRATYLLFTLLTPPET